MYADRILQEIRLLQSTELPIFHRSFKKSSFVLIRVQWSTKLYVYDLEKEKSGLSSVYGIFSCDFFFEVNISQHYSVRGCFFEIHARSLLMFCSPRSGHG